MFNDVVENFRQATETTANLQQEMFKKWINLWPGLPTQPNWQEQAKKIQKKWAEMVADMVKSQTELTEAQFKAGLANIDKAFQMAQAKTTEELRTKSLELWRQCFDNLRKVHEAQVQAFESAMQKWCGNKE